MFQDTSFSQPAAAPKRGSSNSLTHFFIKQLKCLESNQDRELLFHGRPVNLACILGVLKNIEKTSTMIHYKMQDNSASIMCIQYLSGGNDDNENMNLKLDTSVRMCGKLKMMEGKRLFVALVIRPVTAYHEVLFHRLSSLRDVALLDQMSKGMSLAVAMGNPGRELAASLAGQQDFDFNATVSNNAANMGGYNFDTALKNKLMIIIGGSTAPYGMTRVEMEKAIPHVNQKELTDTLRFLADEGHVYTTVTDNHYQITGR